MDSRVTYDDIVRLQAAVDANLIGKPRIWWRVSPRYHADMMRAGAFAEDLRRRFPGDEVRQERAWRRWKRTAWPT